MVAPVGEFSGGEKARLTLALLVRQRPNLLLLDEPTNHLDIDMREALTEALQDYDGALIVVAHDRHLLRATADELWLVADGPRRVVRRRSRRLSRLGARRARAGAAAGTEARGPRPDRRAQKRAEAEARQRRSELRKPLQDKIARIEADSSCSRPKSARSTTGSPPEAYTEENSERLIESLARQGDLTWQLARDEAEWLELHDALGRTGG